LEIDASKASAYRNLGISLMGQSQLLGAVWALTEAVKAEPADDRARAVLKKTLAENPALITRCPWVVDVFDTNSVLLSGGDATM
jgi:hypothetical protein